MDNARNVMNAIDRCVDCAISIYYAGGAMDVPSCLRKDCGIKKDQRVSNGNESRLA